MVCSGHRQLQNFTDIISSPTYRLTHRTNHFYLYLSHTNIYDTYVHASIKIATAADQVKTCTVRGAKEMGLKGGSLQSQRQ